MNRIIEFINRVIKYIDRMLEWCSVVVSGLVQIELLTRYIVFFENSEWKSIGFEIM